MADPKVEQYQSAVITCALAGRVLAQHDIEGLLKAVEWTESVGHVLEPTLYREKAPAMREDAELLKAALPLWRLAKARAA